MSLERRRVWWVERPDLDEDQSESSSDYKYLKIRLAAEWYAINSRDQLVLPITPLHRVETEYVSLGDPGPGLLAQYGGAELALDMMSGAVEPTDGTEWYVEYDPASGFRIRHTSEWTAPYPWVETALDNAP